MAQSVVKVPRSARYGEAAEPVRALREEAHGQVLPRVVSERAGEVRDDGVLARLRRVLRKERPQNPLTVRLPVVPARLADLRAMLAEERPEGSPSLLTSVFAPIGNVHFARVVLLESAVDDRGRDIPASLLFCTDFDGSADDHVAELASSAGFDPLFGCCEHYPASPTPALRAAFLRLHQVSEITFYANTLGRSVRQIRQEDELHRRIRAFLDDQDWTGVSPEQVRGRVQSFVRGESDLAWVHEPVEAFNSPRWEPIRRRLEAVDIAGTLDAIRRFLPLKKADTEPTNRPSNAHVRYLTQFEDLGTQNPFGAVGFVKTGGIGWLDGFVSLIPLFVILPLPDWVTYAVFNSGNLAEVRSIHFARWVPIDSARSPLGFQAPRRALFFSAYDGSQENYMGEFIDAVAWGLNATFSRAVGYPRSVGLVFDGAKDEQAFKNFIRRVQLPTQAWYSAYPHLSTANINANSAIRGGLTGEMDAVEVRAWLKLL